MSADPVKTPYWTNRLARKDEAASILDLVHAVHGESHPELNDAYFNWRYLNETEFRADIVMSEHEGRPVGIQPMAVFDWQWGSVPIKGVMYTGVLTHPEHRRRGVFRSLIDSSNEQAARRGAQFIMTLPNEQSLAGFLRFGQWQYPGLIPLAIKVIDGRAMVRAKAGAAAAALLGWLPPLFFRGQSADGCDDMDFELVSRMPDDLDGVFDQFARDCGRLMIRRTASYWTWRYCTRPAANYRSYIARSGGRVVGAVVTSVGSRFGMDIGMILDVVATGGVPVLCALIRHAGHDLLDRGLGLATCQATSPMLQQALREEGYRIPAPRRLPKRFHFVYRLTGVEGLPRMPEHISDWHLTFGDSDNA